MRINESMRRRWKRSSRRRKEGEVGLRGGRVEGGLAFLARLARQKLSKPVRQ